MIFLLYFTIYFCVYFLLLLLTFLTQISVLSTPYILQNWFVTLVSNNFSGVVFCVINRMLVSYICSPASIDASNDASKDAK